MKTDTHLRLTQEALDTLDTIAVAKGVNRSEAMRYLINLGAHLTIGGFKDTFMPIVHTHGALTIVPVYFDSREKCAQHFPKALGIINLKDHIA